MTEPTPQQTALRIALSAIEDQISLLLIDQGGRFIDPDGWAATLTDELIQIHRDIGRRWGWPGC